VVLKVGEIVEAGQAVADLLEELAMLATLATRGKHLQTARSRS
jgi:hypothetical protein